MSKFLLTVLPLLLLSACSKAYVNVPMPPPPANLSQPCPSINPAPIPLQDPERALWEADMLNAYTLCAARHWLTVQAWQDAVKIGER